jgi:hypothetical protein
LESSLKEMGDKINDHEKVWSVFLRTILGIRSLRDYMAVLLLAKTTFDGIHCCDFQELLVDADFPLFNEYHNSDNHHWRIELFQVQFQKINGVCQ